ncbi:M56 family metallopeptidase [uncultured Lacinutrix sp.]|uniref:M56 family metallopeptidase n=1 Tax=uncultured Lacinutrix sp. TaxID=574032 RepID=UPI002624FDCD|nr:M56 family metallopeptidase [uncultured Lacinutrix sp.]
MLHYILQTVVFQLLFLMVYDVFLKKETFFNWNRFYLLSSALLSVVLPFIKINSFNKIIPQDYIFTLPELVIGAAENNINNVTAITGTNLASETSFNWEYLIYLGCIVTLILFTIKLTRILILTVKSPKEKFENTLLVKLLNSNAAFSFFNYIYIGDAIKTDEKESIVAHEIIHVKEKHTVDLLFFEVLRIIFWFNPMIYLYQNRIANLHEFIADSKAIKLNGKKSYYENLLAQVFDTKKISFINPFFKQSLIKKRIIMLSKSKSKQINLLKYALSIPLLLIMLSYTSCNLNNDDTTNATENIDLEKYTVSRKRFVEASAEDIKKEKEASNFLSTHHDYVSWIVFDYATDISTVSIHHKSEVVPDGYEELRTEITGGRTKVSYRKFINKDKIPVSDSVSLQEIDEIPIFPGCESFTSKEEAKKCLEQSINKIVLKEFKTSIGKEKGLVGKVKLSARFIIGKDGVVKDIKVRAPLSEFVNETIRVIKTMPQLVPGQKDGKPVDVQFLLPITFNIAE